MSRYNLVSALAVIAVLGSALALGAQDAPATPPAAPAEGVMPGPGMGGMAGRMAGFMGDCMGGRMGGGRMGGMEGGMMAGLVWEKFDTNADGVVTAEELAAAAKAQFDESDTDKDGFLSVEEFTAAAGRMAAERMAAMIAERAGTMVDRQDDNGDGKLSSDELRIARVGGDFIKRFDTDGDGKVTRAEFDAVTAKMTQGRQGMAERMKDRMGRHDRDGRDREGRGRDGRGKDGRGKDGRGWNDGPGHR